MKKIIITQKEGFALIAAILAILVLTVLGVLVFMVSTRDLRVSTRSVGEKKAFSAAESGIHRLMQGYDPQDPTSIASGAVVDIQSDPDSRFEIGTVAAPPASRGPASLPMTAYSIEEGSNFYRTRHATVVTGRNDRYNTRVDIGIEMGYGPVKVTFSYDES